VSFLLSSLPDFTEALPFPLNQRAKKAVAAASLDDGFDVAINSLSFILRPSAQNPYQRGFGQVQKDQFDASEAAGEQSLRTWWLRSQRSFAAGSNVRYFEPGSQADTADTFWSSRGVDPWGDSLTLLKRAVKVTESPEVATGWGQVAAVGDAASKFIHVHAAGAGAYAAALRDGDTVVRTYALGATAPAAKPAVGGGYAWFPSGGGVTRATLNSATVVANHFTGAASGAWWVKDRLFVAVGPSLYWLAASDATKAITAGNLVYTHPAADWKWTSVADTPSSVVAAGYGGGSSNLYTIGVVEGASGLPTLNTPTVAWEAPTTEQIICLGSYMGSYLVIGTTRGARVALVTGDGHSVGQLTVETVNPVLDVAFYDRYAYVTSKANLVGGHTGVWRIDLSRPLGETTRYAAASDMATGYTGDPQSLAVIGKGRVVLRTDDGLYVQSATEFEPSGWLETGYVRYATTVSKHYQSASLTGDISTGTVTVEVVDAEGGREGVATLSGSTGWAKPVSLAGQVGSALALRFTMSRTETAQTPRITGWSVAALPLPEAPRLYRLPLQAFDFERNRDGVGFGYVGWSMDRVVALEEFLNSGAGPVAVKIRDTGEEFLAVVDSYSFSSTAPADGPHNGLGGVVDVTLRRL